MLYTASLVYLVYSYHLVAIVYIGKIITYEQFYCQKSEFWNQNFIKSKSPVRWGLLVCV